MGTTLSSSSIVATLITVLINVESELYRMSRCDVFCQNENKKIYIENRIFDFGYRLIPRQAVSFGVIVKYLDDNTNLHY